MIGGALKYQVHAGFDLVIDTLGQPGVWSQAKGALTAPITFGFNTAGKNDEAIINAYGLEAVILTAKSGDFPVPPVKFDKIVMGGRTFVAQAVHRVDLMDELIGYKIIVKGHS